MEREHPKVIDTNLHLQSPPTNITPGMEFQDYHQDDHNFLYKLKILINQV